MHHRSAIILMVIEISTSTSEADIHVPVQVDGIPFLLHYVFIYVL